MQRVARALFFALFLATCLGVGVGVGARAPALAQQEPADVEAGVVGAGDTLRLRVFEWRPSTGEAHAWEAFDDEFVVGADGRLSLPLIGPLDAAGRSTGAIGEEIATQLQETAGLLEKPSAVVEIRAYRPFYVVGAVSRPGEYPYRPGLTVLQAISIAGGMRRGPDAFDRFERDAISGRGELRVIALELDQLAARRARLEAELEDAAEIAFPERLVERRPTDPAVDLMLREEDLILRSRRESLEQEVDANERLQALLAGQVAQLEEQMALKQSQVDSIAEEVERVRGLVERGLGTASRLSDLERRLADYESDRGTITRSLIRAQVDINQAERNIIALHAARRREVAREMRQTQAEMEKMRERFATASAMLQEAEVIAPAKREAANRRDLFEPIYSIVRTTDGETKEAVVEEFTPIRPGDTVRAIVPMPDIGGGEEVAPSSNAAPGGSASYAASEATGAR
ncbi:polysaccharide biosynthesis/export family protein [Salinarimonas sp.]|uniref:polysaccharide biosynthesis/export family protein n=1 Tax=Salinarimonas sp. TaxID=2766526 RepID=UPI0032D921F7